MAGELTTTPVKPGVPPTIDPQSPPKGGKRPRAPREARPDGNKGDDKSASTGIPLLRPGEDDHWELSHVRRNAGVFRIEDRVEHPRKVDDANGAIIAIPSHLSFSVPLWLATEDQSLFGDMVRFQLEKRGLLGSNDLTEGRLQITPILTENGRSLVLAALLSATFPRELCFIDARAYELAASTYPIPDNAAALWRENGRIVMACRRKGALVAVQTFNGTEIDFNIAGEIACVLLELISSDVLPEITRIQLWGNFSRDERAAIDNLWDSEITVADRPGLILPAKSAPFLPPEVELLRRRRRAGKRLFLFTAVAISIYLVFLTLFVGKFAMLKWQVMNLENQLAENSELVTLIQETQLAWESLIPAIDPEYFAVEQLLQASKSLPPEGVRFTLFQSQPGQILIRGEARSFREAQAYYQQLEQTPELQPFTWTLGNPKIEADGRASFQIEGIRQNFHAPTDS